MTLLAVQVIYRVKPLWLTAHSIQWQNVNPSTECSSAHLEHCEGFSAFAWVNDWFWSKWNVWYEQLHSVGPRKPRTRDGCSLTSSWQTAVARALPGVGHGTQRAILLQDNWANIVQQSENPLIFRGWKIWKSPKSPEHRNGRTASPVTWPCSVQFNKNNTEYSLGRKGLMSRFHCVCVSGSGGMLLVPVESVAAWPPCIGGVGDRQHWAESALRAAQCEQNNQDFRCRWGILVRGHN